MKKVLGLGLLLALAALPAQAQTVTNPAVAAMVCANNTVVPSPVNAQFYYVQCDSNGKLITSSTGTVPGGSNTQVQYNNAGAFGGITGATTNGTALTLVAPVLGTPASGVATNLTGTAAGLTAGTVTTNANLTGPITSSGNATAIASQTGTGTKFVVDTSPALITPALGVATGTTLAIGGCAIGGFAICVTGTASFSSSIAAGGAVNASSLNSGAGSVIWASTAGGADGNLVYTPAISLTLGSTAFATDTRFSRSSAGVAQVGTTANNALGSLLLTGLTASGALINTGITTDATHTDSTVCQDTTSHQFYAGSGAVGICLGTSGRQFKQDFTPMTAGLAEIIKLPLHNYRYRKGFGDDGSRQQYGLVAQDVAEVLPDLAGRNASGEIINYDWGALVFVSMRAIQELKADNDNLRALITRSK